MKIIKHTILDRLLRNLYVMEAVRCGLSGGI